MNRLKFMKAYLVGPMDHDRHSGREWRDMMSDWLRSRGVIPMNPYKKPLTSLSKQGLEDDDNYLLRKLAIKRGDRKEAARLTKPLRATDLRMVDETSFQIVNLDIEKRPCGTYEEIFTGNREKKPAIIFCPQGVENIPDWMYGTLPTELMFDDWEDVKDYLDHIDSDPDEQIDTLNRWVFFDLEDEYRAICNRTDEEWTAMKALADFGMEETPTG